MDVVAYGCTSASMAIGEDRVFERIRAGQAKAKCTTPITAAFAAFRALQAKRIAVLTPYTADVNEIVADYIRERGFEVPAFGSFNEPSDAVVASISPPSLETAVRTIVDQSDVDAVFVSCTSLRLTDAVASIEANIGLPVTSSNHAMAWHAIRLAGVEDRLEGLGRLFLV
jgi:maleate isomerase